MKNVYQEEESIAFNRRFKYAVIVYAVVELIAIVAVVYYKTRH